MRIAALVYRFPSVSQTFVLNQITGLLERGHTVEIFADQRGTENTVHADVHSYQLTSRTTYYDIPSGYGGRLAHAVPLFWRTFARSTAQGLAALNLPRYGIEAASLRLLYEINVLQGRGDFDIIHCHFGPNGLIGAKLRDVGALRGKLFTSFYGYDISETHLAGKYDFLFRHADVFLVVSEQMRARLVEMGCPSEKIRVHHLGIDTRLFSPRPRVPHSDLRLLTIARFVPKKGIEYALRAVAQARVRVPNLRYTIVGDGVLRPQIEALVNELHLEDIVVLVGWNTRQQVLDLLQNSDMLLAPSITAPGGDAEGTPVVLMEAMAMECAVISTRHSAIPEIITHKESGWLVPERSVDALVDAIETLATSSELGAQLGKNARCVIEQRYNIERLNDRLAQLYMQ